MFLATNADPTTVRRARLTRSHLLPIGGKALIDEGDLRVDGWMANALLLCNKLDQLVGTLDVHCAVLQSASRRSRPRQRLGCGCILLKRD